MCTLSRHMLACPGSHLEAAKAAVEGMVPGQGNSVMGANTVCPASPFSQLILGSCDSSVLDALLWIVKSCTETSFILQTECPCMPGPVWALGRGNEQDSLFYSLEWGWGKENTQQGSYVMEQTHPEAGPRDWLGAQAPVIPEHRESSLRRMYLSRDLNEERSWPCLSIFPMDNTCLVCLRNRQKADMAGA